MQSSSPVYRHFWALWRGKVSALVLQVLATQTCGIKLAFSMCLLLCLHCNEVHKGQNRGSPAQPVLSKLCIGFCLNGCSLNVRYIFRKRKGLLFRNSFAEHAKEHHTVTFAYRLTYLDIHLMEKAHGSLPVVNVTSVPIFLVGLVYFRGRP